MDDMQQLEQFILSTEKRLHQCRRAFGLYHKKSLRLAQQRDLLVEYWNEISDNQN